MTETRWYYGLSYRERTVLEAIRDYVADHGYPPTHREIAGALGLSSACGIGKHLDELQRKGYLWRGRGPRAITLR